jgi:acetolactate synthase-1/3 small subunit
MLSKKKHIILFVENKSGVLNRVTSLLRRRNVNIESLTVAPSLDKNYSHITISLFDNIDIRHVSKYLHKLINVIKVWTYDNYDLFIEEIIFIKISLTKNTRSEILQLSNLFNADLLELSEKSISFKLSDNLYKIEKFIEIMKPFGLKELIRSGSTAMLKDIR